MAQVSEKKRLIGDVTLTSFVGVNAMSENRLQALTFVTGIKKYIPYLKDVGFSEFEKVEFYRKILSDFEKMPPSPDVCYAEGTVQTIKSHIAFVSLRIEEAVAAFNKDVKAANDFVNALSNVQF